MNTLLQIPARQSCFNTWTGARVKLLPVGAEMTEQKSSINMLYAVSHNKWIFKSKSHVPVNN